jgi:hypothetical protein
MVKNCQYVLPKIKASAGGLAGTNQINLADKFEIDADCSITMF